jgi:signal transduction histidine kinase
MAFTRASYAISASRSIQTRVVADGLGRHGPTVEEAVFFCTSEAIQNATKHGAPLTHVNITLGERDENLSFEVADDGRGFNASEQRPGFGLTSMEDRIEAVGGKLEISSSPGGGTRVRGVIPRGTSPLRWISS